MSSFLDPEFTFFKRKMLWGGTVDRRAPAPVDTEKCQFFDTKYSFISLHHPTTVCISKSLAENGGNPKLERFEHLTAWLPPIRLKKRRPCFFWSAKTPYIPTAPRAEKAFLDEGCWFLSHLFVGVSKVGRSNYSQ